MKDLREEVGTKACTVGKIVKSRIKWAGHIIKMKDERSPKRSDTKKQEGCRKRGRPHIRWEDCVKRDLRKAEEEEKWRENGNNMDQCKQLTKVAVHRSDHWSASTPTKGKPEEEQEHSQTRIREPIVPDRAFDTTARNDAFDSLQEL